MSSHAGMSSDRLARIDRHLKTTYVDSGKLPGTLAMVSRRGKIVHTSVLGLADRERNKPLKEDTIFRIYSMTKPITSVAFMMLVEEGRVALDEPVHKYIPEWKNLGVFQAGIWPAFLTRPPSRPIPRPRPAPAASSAALAARFCGYRAQNPDEGRHDLPHLLHDQADHEHRLHDAGRGRPHRARGARPSIYP